MGKIRVYELAKKHNIQSKEMINVLKKLNLPVNNHMSTVDDEMIKKIEEYFTSLKQGDSSKQNKTTKANKKNQKNQKDSKKRDKEGISKVSSKEVSNTEIKEDEPIDDKELVASAKKKTKSNKKRFDDNKVSDSTKNGKKGKANKKKNKNKKEAEEKRVTPNKTPEKIVYTGSLTVGELAKQLGKETSEIIKKLMFLGIMATINQEIEFDAIQLIAEEYGVKVEEKIEVDEDQFELFDDEDREEDLVERPPVVTIMGHVDHGKTTLLDAIRNSKITAKEAGGITQHIGAYQVEINGKKITFLDTPGHAAFTSMRARGAQVTDITILVVAADDGVMPQTVEAINHAKAANAPIIVAVNKIDKPEANIEKVKQELTEYGLVPEEWGGDTIYVPVSALKQQGLDDLLEMILLVAEVEELKANPNRLARGTIIESQLDRGRGAVATVLVQKGTLRVGDPIVAGITYGKVRAIVNDRGKRIKEAGPSTPVEITGLNEVPQAGDQFIAFEEERKARIIGEKRALRARQEELNATSRVTLDDLYKRIQEGDIKELNVIIKGDVQGSVEALQGALEKIEVEGVRVKIIHKGVGAITETDVTLASASNAIIIGFNVRPEPQARTSAEREKVDIRLHRIIYNVIEEIEAALRGMLDPEYEEVITGRADVRQIFKASNIGTIAGCMVTEGKIVRSASVRVIRDGVVIFEGKIDSLKRYKDDVKEVAQGYECGITIEKFNDIKDGDIIESFVLEAVKK
ncbi:translation initiation factor IF-2 [Vulcanibacillus modesticaldus]|uniref:Translation initiation factor IF-2 n=1 Tax=Vulcanibacillus modesticaldus TaxID=337097 RepID=A0A1D2YXN8_9BACI|nr:translation initiation factor IF-2 [Vulcanibacillus modesticaldus]OEG00443.1 translation initiation factor IF-2 [Vulcanibacillus modesticaldus]